MKMESLEKMLFQKMMIGGQKVLKIIIANFKNLKLKSIPQLVKLICRNWNVLRQYPKAELQLEGIFFTLMFLPREFLLVKKLEIKKTKTTKYTTFKTDIIKVILVFSISNFNTNKNSQGIEKPFSEKSTLYCIFGFTV